MLGCRFTFGGGGAGHVRCGGNGGGGPLVVGPLIPLPLVLITLFVSFTTALLLLLLLLLLMLLLVHDCGATLFIDPPPPGACIIWCFSCSLSTFTWLVETAFKVFVVGVLSGVLGRFVLDTDRVGGGGGRLAGGRGGGATVGRPETGNHSFILFLFISRYDQKKIIGLFASSRG